MLQVNCSNNQGLLNTSLYVEREGSSKAPDQVVANDRGVEQLKEIAEKPRDECRRCKRDQ